MADYDYDLFVIGAGSGGVRAARLTALGGKKVAIAEEHRVGGTCVIRGCVPKKFMVMASDFAHQFHTAEGYGWTVEASFDWPKFIETKDVEIARLSGIYAANLGKAGVELIHGRAVLTDAHTVVIAGKGEDGGDLTVTAERILIATGGRPWMPEELPGIEHAITSEEAFHLPELPKRILIAGGGYIAVEFAGIFAGLGVETTLIYRGPNILRGFDDDVRAHLAGEIEKRGIKVVLGCQHKEIRKTDSGLVNVLENGMELETDVVMFATGRVPHVKSLGLETAGVALNDKGAIQVDTLSKTTADNIWAIGDVTDRMNLTPVAIREAVAFHETVYKGNPQHFDYEAVATAVFSQPPVGTVGLSESEARRTCSGAVDIYSTKFRPMKYAFTGSDERVLMKLVVDASNDRVVGVHIVGPEAPEMIQLAAIAVKAGLTKAQWDATCAVHPTMAEELVTLKVKQNQETSAG
ncbi:glutathione-disulfide reductase [Brevundimonas subvibrioides]|uniref:Glutathione reductase n=1 Tax=Brevundimonas subvibrioides (strain ATCC 15264 / DSM 4735 / LMG 14903 / NBRC 16000 / CB 81) TaxID=633149 RepID=D9QGR5_BRESC|nr:glutathione-disulfide reductase [Brevundimonas subvibrioides]ADL00881.1 glutathione-disulfide reductase [Brevundimonas subvibrioides ATCC 15264]